MPTDHSSWRVVKWADGRKWLSGVVKRICIFHQKLDWFIYSVMLLINSFLLHFLLDLINCRTWALQRRKVMSSYCDFVSQNLWRAALLFLITSFMSSFHQGGHVYTSLERNIVKIAICVMRSLKFWISTLMSLKGL